MKRISLVVALLSIGGLLSACSNEKAKEQKETASISTTSVSKRAKSSHQSSAKRTSLRGQEASQQESSKVTDALWDKTKDEQLQAFINSWEVQMGQTYTKYDGKNSLKTSPGTTYPDIFNGNGVYSDGQKLSIGWAPTGKGPYEYNVVAIYNYDGDQPPLPNHITYLFAFHNGQPVALVDQSREGDVRVSPTQNTDVAENFKSIASGKGYDQQKFVATNDTNKIAVSMKEIAVMTYYEASNGGIDAVALKEVAEKGFLGIEYRPKYDNYMIGQGTGASSIILAKEGDVIKYWKRSPEGPTAERIMYTTTLQTLKDKYFKTKEQQELVRQTSAHIEEYHDPAMDK